MKAYLTDAPLVSRLQTRIAELAVALHEIGAPLNAGEWNGARYWADKGLDLSAELAADLSALQRLIDAHQRPA